MSVLLVDGDNLLTIGFYGCKNFFYKGEHIGGIYHFLNTLKKSLETYHLDKICVFWDGENSSQERKKIYFQYKENRRSSRLTEEGQNSTHNSPNEKKIVYSSDRDLAQLVNKDVSLYNPSHGKLYEPNSNIEYDKETILIENVKLVKILCGDPSDNIAGIRNLGIKRLLTLFPDFQTKTLTLEEVRKMGDDIFEKDKENKMIQNFLSGVTKLGVLGEEFFYINNKMVNLDEPILTDEARQDILALVNDSLDTEGRSYKNCMKMMMEDGIFTVLPKYNDAWLNFLNPFLRLTTKEKNKKKIIKFKIN